MMVSTQLLWMCNAITTDGLAQRTMQTSQSHMYLKHTCITTTSQVATRCHKEINADYIVPENSGQQFEAVIAKDQDTFTIGNIIVTALHTPGHTPHHMSYAVSDGQKSIVCTGGGLLYGTVGRTDLISESQTSS